MRPQDFVYTLKQESLIPALFFGSKRRKYVSGGVILNCVNRGLVLVSVHKYYHMKGVSRWLSYKTLVKIVPASAVRL